MDLLDELRKAREKDSKFKNIIGSMCTAPHPIAKKAFKMFIETNLGDYELFSGTKEIEEKAVKWVANLMHAPHSYGGISTSGGTESNITSLWIFKKLGKGNEVILPKQAHFSFLKAASLLDLKLKFIDCKFFMRAKDLNKKISKKTLCVVAIAGNTNFGYIDEIEEIAEICNNENIFMHVDAAFGGFTAPFVSNKKIDFRSKISSICLDAHKMGMSCIPCGFLIFKERIWLEEIKIRSKCTHTRFQVSLLGTRPGASVASAYAVMRYMGREGYRKVAKDCMEKTFYLADLLCEANLEYFEPELNIVAIKVREPFKVAKELAEIGWYVGIDEENGTIRCVIMPHVSKRMINKFVDDLEKVVK
ncbi:MAG: tyrosine decarboxylase MfnA [Thermoplasmatales archaeon]|nr:tyrosine decarboxylase MfnA [Thermoplasmatales archaeon]